MKLLADAGQRTEEEQALHKKRNNRVRQITFYLLKCTRMLVITAVAT